MTPAGMKAWLQRLTLFSLPKMDEPAKQPSSHTLREEARRTLERLSEKVGSDIQMGNRGRVMDILNDTDELKRTLRLLLNQLKQENGPK